MKLLEILNEVSSISEFLTRRYNHDSGEELKQYLSRLNGYIARLPKLEAEAEFLLNQAKGKFADEQAENVKKKVVSATIFKEQLDSACANENKVYKFVYRLNKNIIEIHRGVITQLSYEKAQAPSRTENDLIEKITEMDKEIKRVKDEIKFINPGVAESL